MVINGGRSPYGERGLKFLCWFVCGVGWRRSPYGERGLKFANSGTRMTNGYTSLSLRRAWIEIASQKMHYQEFGVALLTESVD